MDGMRTDSQKVQAAQRCQLDVLHGRHDERAVGRCYSAAFSAGCLRKRPSNVLQNFALQNISGSRSCTEVGEFYVCSHL